MNHTHVFDEFRNDTKAIRKTVQSEEIPENGETFAVLDWTYDETHPDFLAACEPGRSAARIWAVRLFLEFPGRRFRVYYTEYDNLIIRFHKVRPDEPVYLGVCRS